MTPKISLKKDYDACDYEYEDNYKLRRKLAKNVLCEEDVVIKKKNRKREKSDD
jgi:hypothetical protein